MPGILGPQPDARSVIEPESPALRLPFRHLYPSIRTASAACGERLRVALFSGNYDCARDGANQALNTLVDHLLFEGVLVNPSVTEAFGNVNLEVMASGIAIVSARVDSAETLVKHGSSGLLVKADDVEGYADALEQLILSRHTRVALGTAAAQRALSHDWQTQLSTVVSVYRACRGSGR